MKIPENTCSNQLTTWSKYDWFAILTLFLLTLAYFYNVVIPLDSSVLSDQNTDTRHQLFYWRYFGFNTLAKGTIPLWNPYIYSGAPFVAGVQSAIFYPLNLIYLIFPIHVAINYSVILHVFLSGVFTYLYLRCLNGIRTQALRHGQSVGANGRSPVPSMPPGNTRLGMPQYENAGGLSRASCMVSAIIFMFCAPQIFHVYPGHLPNLCTMIWLPLILLFSELFIRSRNYLYSLLCGCAVAMNVLAGHPQYFFYTTIAVAIYFTIRVVQEYRGHRQWKYVGLHASGFFTAYAAGVLLSGIQLLPAFEMVQHSTRQDLSYEWVGQFSFAPENFVTLFLPEFFGNLLKTPYWGRYYLWEMSLYVGILPLMLCAIAAFYARNKFAKAFLILALITAILALGKFTPLFRFLYAFVPGFNMFRGNSKFIFVVAFSLSVLAGIGADCLQNAIAERTRHPATKKGAFSLFLSITIGIVAAVSLFLVVFFLCRTGFGAWHSVIRKICLLGDRYTDLPDLKDAGFLRGTFAVAAKDAAKFIVLMILSLLVIGLWVNGRLRRQVIVPITMALIFGDLWFFGNQYMVTYDARQCFWNKDLLAAMQGSPDPFRVTTVGHFELNQGMAHNVANIGGYDANVIKEYSEYINLSDGKPVNEPRIVMEVRQVSRLTNLLNLTYILLPAHVKVEHPNIKPVYRDQKYALYHNTLSLPRAFIVHEAKTLQGRDAIFRELAGKEFDPARYIVLEEPVRPVGNINLENLPKEPLPSVLEYSPNKVIIKASLQADGYLVLGDTFYPGWNVYVDGKRGRVLKANYVMRSVFLEKGDHVVQFVYEPKSFTVGMIITLASMAVIIPVSVFCYRSKRKEHV